MFFEHFETTPTEVRKMHDAKKNPDIYFHKQKGSEPLPFLLSHSIPCPIIPSVAGIPYLSSRSLYQIP